MGARFYAEGDPPAEVFWRNPADELQAMADSIKARRAVPPSPARQFTGPHKPAHAVARPNCKCRDCGNLDCVCRADLTRAIDQRRGSQR